MKVKKSNLVIVLVSVVLFALWVWYAKFQFDLCFPEVSTSIWYCLQHAS